MARSTPPQAAQRSSTSLAPPPASSHKPACSPSTPSTPKPPRRPRFVDAADYLSVLWTYLTEALCAEVFAATRDRERQRKWTLFTLVKFWVALLHEGPEVSQTRALANCTRGHPLYPVVTATPEAFFQRIQALRPAFFRAVFTRVTVRVLERLAALSVRFATALPLSPTSWPEIYCVDGSRLDAVAHRVKLLQRTPAVVLPGGLAAVYDLRRGCLRELLFEPDSHRGEQQLFAAVLADLPPGALLVLDRYYAKPALLNLALMVGVAVVARTNGTVQQHRVRWLRRVRTAQLAIDDALVVLGGARGTVSGPTLVRSVRIRLQYKGRRQTLTLLTTVLDPRSLLAEHLAALYGRRWTVERMFLTMKDTLHLRRLYNCTPAAVSQQVYATALLYNALRLAQLELAERLQLAPEALSPERLFPQLLERLEQRTWAEVGALLRDEQLRAHDPSLPPFDPVALAAALDRHPRWQLEVATLLVTPRKGRRKRPRFCAARARHTSYAKLRGGKRYLKQ